VPLASTSIISFDSILNSSSRILNNNLLILPTNGDLFLGLVQFTLGSLLLLIKLSIPSLPRVTSFNLSATSSSLLLCLHSVLCMAHMLVKYFSTTIRRKLALEYSFVCTD
jgi:hypothetical protein